MSFSHLGLSAKVLAAIESAGYKTPTPIQEQAIPHVLARRDVLGIAQTGTGKTAAFVLPMLTMLEQGRARARMPRTLILEPTRELAAQVVEHFEKYGKNHKLNVALIIGGVSFGDQDAKLTRGVDVLIATPGRLLDHSERGRLLLSGVELLVIDEADRMLDMGFIHDIKRIVAMLRKERQTLFFSATMPQEITKLADQMLRDPARVAVTPQASTVEKVQQRVILTEKASKPALLAELLKSEPVERVLVFTRTKHGADKVVRGLQNAGHAAEAIHGNKSQNQRERVLANFRTGSLRILIATDIAARGIDVDGVSHVVNYDLPNIPESYVHRIGRTARAGAEGIAISFCDYEEAPFLRDIERLIRMAIPATDRRTGQRPAHRPAQQNAGNRNGGRPHRNGHQQRGHGGGNGGGGNGRHQGNNGHRSQAPGNGHQGRYPSQNGQQAAPRAEATSGEPNGIGNVTFLQRPNEPRRNAGHRTQS